MGLFNTLKRWNDEADASILGEDAAKEWHRQSDGWPPDDDQLEALAKDLAPGHEESFMDGFDERWQNGYEAQSMNVLERFWKSKQPL